METIVSALATHQFGAVGRSQLRRLGLTDRQIERRLTNGRLTGLARGVYALYGSRPTWERSVIAAWLVTNERRHPGVLALSTAAAMHGLAGYPCAGRPLLLAFHGDRHPNPLGTVMRRSDLEDGDIGLHSSGAPITNPVRTVLDLAMADGRTGRAERVIDTAIAQSLVSFDALVERFEALAAKGKPGTAHVRRVLLGPARSSRRDDAPALDLAS